MSLSKPSRMKFLFTLILSFASLLSFGQYKVSGKVVDSNDKLPLAFVNITINGSNIGSSTDLDGEFEIDHYNEIKSIELSYLGYSKVRINNPIENMTLEMVEVTSKLSEVVVVAGVNPAHRIINFAAENRNLNKPEANGPFSYKSYSKFIFTAEQDTNDAKIVRKEFSNEDTSYFYVDSSGYNLAEYLDDKHLFLIETLTERKYLPPSRDNETVLANRTSGFENPMFSLIATELQSFSFYQDFISIAGQDYLNPITPKSTGRYFYIIEDTLFNSPIDTVFKISFRPRENQTFNCLVGEISINTSNWAIENVKASPAKSKDEVGINIFIQQLYKRFDDHAWFPVQLNADLDFGANVSINTAMPVATMRTYLFDISLNAELNKKDISRASVSLNENSQKESDALLAQYRPKPIDPKEERTYEFVDSVGDEFNFDRNLKILQAFVSGKVPVYFIDIDLNRILNYNYYEGIRLGFGAHTNGRFSDWFKIGGYYAYGFGDEVSKYGWDAEATINKNTGFKLYGGYLFDIFETGGLSYLIKPAGSIFQDNYRQLFIPQFDEVSRYYAGIKYDVLGNLASQVEVRRENNFTVGDYAYSDNPNEDVPFSNGFNYSEAVLSFKYTPKTRFVEGGGMNKIILQENYPQFFLQYTNGFKSELLESDFSYNKLDLKAILKKRSIILGESTLEVGAGKVFGDVPYQKLYAGRANWVRDGSLLEGIFNIADRSSFETMRFNEFVSDQYFLVAFRQDLKSLLFKKGKFAPHIEIVSRVMFGSLDNPENHNGLSNSSLEEGYYESGLELNRLLVNGISGFGFGFYYRYGPYHLAEFEDNFAIKLSSKFSF